MLLQAYSLLAEVSSDEMELSEGEENAKWQARNAAETTLASINISSDDVVQFKAELTAKYHQKYTDDDAFERQVNRSFNDKKTLGSDFQVFNKSLSLIELCKSKENKKRQREESSDEQVYKLPKVAGSMNRFGLLTNSFNTNSELETEPVECENNSYTHS